MYILILLLPLIVIFFIYNVIKAIYLYFKIEKMKKDFRDKFGHTDYFGDKNNY